MSGWVGLGGGMWGWGGTVGLGEGGGGGGSTSTLKMRKHDLQLCFGNIEKAISKKKKAFRQRKKDEPFQLALASNH